MKNVSILPSFMIGNENDIRFFTRIADAIRIFRLYSEFVFGTLYEVLESCSQLTAGGRFQPNIPSNLKDALFRNFLFFAIKY
jgi:hypothetical protein